MGHKGLASSKTPKHLPSSLLYHDFLKIKYLKILSCEQSMFQVYQRIRDEKDTLCYWTLEVLTKSLV